jgi:branched-chain amino acid transport system ATP-binding protein
VTALLEVRGVEVHYGSTQVLFGVDLTVKSGEIVALLGTNGAGKSTLLNAVTGLRPPSSGSIHLDGDDITGLLAHRVVQCGVSLVPGGRGVFPTLTVAENLELATWTLDGSPADVTAALDRLLAQFPVLRERWRMRAGDLSGGEQQMIALGQAMLTDPSLLLIDELSLGLAPIVVDELLGHLVELNRDGLSLLLIEQFVHRALEVAARIYVLAKGRVQLSGSAQDIAGAAALETAYLSGGS